MYALAHLVWHVICVENLFVPGLCLAWSQDPGSLWLGLL
jgi:hypothetical protein